MNPKPSSGGRAKPVTKHAARKTKATGPVRWDSLQHENMAAQAENDLKLGSCDRSSVDAAFYVAKRRLASKNPEAHATYARIECAHLVELLRALRTVYRKHLEKLGCRPLDQMYWVVFRFGVMDWAIRMLRSAVRNYVLLSDINRMDWEVLFGPLTFVPFGEEEYRASKGEIVRDGPELEASIRQLLHRDCFNEIVTGGPFGRDGQVWLAHTMAVPAMVRGASLPHLIERGQERWDRCSTWTEPLGWMFDAVQEELMAQRDALPAEGRHAEILFPHLPPFDQIVHKHFVSLRPARQGSVGLGKEGWLALTRDLDENGVKLDYMLTQTAQQVLASIRKKRIKIASWETAYLSPASTSLEDGKRRSIRRELTLFVHNEAKRVARLLSNR